MTAIRLRLRAAAVVWQQTAVCEPDLETVVASADEVACWGAGLPLATHPLARAVIGDQAFALIAAPDVGVAWVAAAAVRPGDGLGRAVLTEPTTAYGVHTRCEWRAIPAGSDERRAIWQLEREPDDDDWLFVRRLVGGAPVGPLSYVAVGDVVERWTAEACDPGLEEPPAPSPPAAPEPPEPPDAASTGTLLAFLRRGVAEPDIAQQPSATGDGVEPGSDEPGQTPLDPSEAASPPGVAGPGEMRAPLREAAGPPSMPDESWDLAWTVALDVHTAADAALPGASARDAARGANAVLPARGAMYAASGSGATRTRGVASPIPDMRSSADASSIAARGRDPGPASNTSHRGHGAMDASSHPDASQGSAHATQPSRASARAADAASNASTDTRTANPSNAEVLRTGSAKPTASLHAQGPTDATSHVSTPRSAQGMPPGAIARAADAASSGASPQDGDPRDAVHALAIRTNDPAAKPPSGASHGTSGPDSVQAPHRSPGAMSAPSANAGTRDTAPASTPTRASEATDAIPVSSPNAGTRDAAYPSTPARASGATDAMSASSAARGTPSSLDAARPSSMRDPIDAASASITTTGAAHAGQLGARASAAMPPPTAHRGAPAVAGTRAASTATPDARAAVPAARLPVTPGGNTPAVAISERSGSRDAAPGATVERASGAAHTVPTSTPHTARGAEAERASTRTAATDEPSRGRIAVVRRAGDDLGLPSLPPPSRGAGVPASRHGASGETSAGPRTSTGPQLAAARARTTRAAGESRRSTAPQASAVPAPSTAANDARTPTTARTAESAPIATRTAAPIATHTATSPAPHTASLDLMPVATLIEPAAPPPIPHSAPRRTVNREVRVGDIIVEVGDPLPTRPAVEHAGTLTAAIPRRNLEPRRRL